MSVLEHFGDTLEAEEDVGLTSGELPEDESCRSTSSHSRLRRLVVIWNALLLASAAVLVVLSTLPAEEANLIRGSVHDVMAAYDPLSSSASGMPGMPMGIDDDDYSQPQGSKNGVNTVASPDSCSDNEEHFGGFCYKKCSILTGGTHPQRVAGGVCCLELSIKCVLNSHSKFSGFFPGEGYNVDGKGEAPHPPGMCDGNEEMHLGLCYKKCSILTNNEFNIRVTANSCCKARSCLNPWNLKTIGGSCDGHSVGGGFVREHRCPHPPTKATVS